jgi:hypothetical protein
MNHRSKPVPGGTSRRSFLLQALGGTALAARPAVARPRDRERGRIARALARYGSELGDVRRVEGRE